MALSTIAAANLSLLLAEMETIEIEYSKMEDDIYYDTTIKTN